MLPAEEERSLILLALVPVRVKVPEIVWVVPAVKVSCFPAVVQVKLLKVVEPERIDVAAVSKVTVPEEWVKVPAEWVKLPATVKLFPEPGAVSVPDEIVTAPLASIFPLVAVRVPPSTVKLPVVVKVLALVELSKVPEVTFNAPATVKLALV